MPDDRELIAAVGNIGRAPVRPGIIPTQQAVASPSTLTPNSGVRVDEGAVPTPMSVNGMGERAPRVGITPTNPVPSREPVVTTPQGNPVPNITQQQVNSSDTPDEEKPSSGKKKKKKGNLKTTMIAVGLGGGLLLILIMLVLAKGNGTSGPEGVLSSPTSVPSSDIVQNFQEYDDPFGLGGEDEWIVESFEYSEQEYADLRKVGYTSSEIEGFKKEELSAAPLIEKAKEEREAYLQETVAPYYDGRSEEFKKLENDTWVGLPQVDESSIPKTSEELNSVSVTKKTINTDYEKVLPRGNQLFIKVYTDKKHSSWVYYQCDFYQWSSLEDDGNIVVEVTISTYTGENAMYNNWKVDTITVY